MKIIELTSNIKYMLSNEELVIYNLIKEKDTANIEEFDEREQLLIKKMISNNVLKYDGNNITLNTRKDLWRI